MQQGVDYLRAYSFRIGSTPLTVGAPCGSPPPFSQAWPLFPLVVTSLVFIWSQLALVVIGFAAFRTNDTLPVRERASLLECPVLLAKGDRNLLRNRAERLAGKTANGPERDYYPSQVSRRISSRAVKPDHTYCAASLCPPLDFPTFLLSESQCLIVIRTTHFISSCDLRGLEPQTQ